MKKSPRPAPLSADHMIGTSHSQEDLFGPALRTDQLVSSPGGISTAASSPGGGVSTPAHLHRRGDNSPDSPGIRKKTSEKRSRRPSKVLSTELDGLFGSPPTAAGSAGSHVGGGEQASSSSQWAEDQPGPEAQSPSNSGVVLEYEGAGVWLGSWVISTRVSSTSCDVWL